MQRLVQPEILDSLSTGDPAAVASRRDLVKINHWMGNYRWISSKVQSYGHPKTAGQHYLEIGAGDGSLAKRLYRYLPSEMLDALDLSSKPDVWPADARWITDDLVTFNEYDKYTHLIANLILHHFEAEDLQQLGSRIHASGIRAIIACEPCRRSCHQWQLRAGKWIGFNHVTLHDGCVSVQAGFRGVELPELLGLPASDWEWQITETWMGAYRMCAQRK
jgi:hypothetical protein